MTADPADWLIERIYEQTGTTQHPGGQQAGTPAYAIRVTHKPTGIMAQCSTQRSDFGNKRIAREMIEWALSYDR